MVSRDKTLILRKSDSHLKGHRSCLVRGLETVSTSWWIKPHFLQECLEQSYFKVSLTCIVNYMYMYCPNNFTS